MILLIGGEKGGPGKSTIATNLAAIRVSENKDVLLIDTDKQPTASYWCAVREDNNFVTRVPSIQKFDKAIKNEIKELEKKYDDIIIDAGGRDSIELRSSLLVADTVVFPLRPSQFDLWTLERLSNLVEHAQEINNKLIPYILLNQNPTNRGGKEIEEAKSFVAEFNNLKLLKTIICERIVFRRAAIEGLSVIEYKPNDIKASKEIKNLYREIYYE